MDHNWKIYDLKRVIDNGVVTEITYACESQLSGSGTRKIGNLTVVGSSDDSDFISYDNLTQTDVLGWVYASVDKTIFETENSSSIAQQITRRAAITTKTGTPW
jgi:hypothetical protein